MTELNSFLVEAFINALKEWGRKDPKFFVNVYMPFRVGIDLVRENYRGLANFGGEILDLISKS